MNTPINAAPQGIAAVSALSRRTGQPSLPAVAAPLPIILKTSAGDYVGEGGTFNSIREYAKRFRSEEEGRSYTQANRMHGEFIAETA